MARKVRKTAAETGIVAAAAAAVAAAVDRERPNFDIEAFEIECGNGPIAGVDEAGRGPWAGPVVAAAVILDPRAIPSGLDDSKVLDEGRRERLFAELKASGARIGVGIADVDLIDRINILQATLWAMTGAVRRLGAMPGLVLVDGNRLPRLDCAARAIVGGDRRCLSIAAASIVAKVTRDRLMGKLAIRHAGYGFERHKGYGTPEHKSALERLGPCPAHRRSFAPVRAALIEAGLEDIGLRDSCEQRKLEEAAGMDPAASRP